MHTQADKHRQSSQVDTDTKNIKTDKHTTSSIPPSSLTLSLFLCLSS